MKNTLLNLSIVLVTLAALGWIWSRRSVSDRFTPALVLTPAIYDLGRLSTSSAPASLVLQVRNNSRGHLIVTNVSTSCGCTTAGLDGAADLAPGETRAIGVTFTNGERTGDVQAAVSVEARSEEGRKLEATSIVRSHGVTAVSVQPKAVRLGLNEYGQPPTRVVVHLERGEEALEWDGIECAAGEALAVRTSSVDGARFDLEVSLKELNGVIGAGSGQLVVHLTRRGERLAAGSVVLPVSWEIAHPALTVHPSMVYLGVLARNSAHTGTVRIAASGGKALRALASTSPSERLRVELDPGVPANLVESRYSMTTGSQTGEFTSLVETRVLFEGAEYRVRTPVVGYVR